MKRALVIAALLFIVAPAGAQSPRIRSSAECVTYADLALVAAALAKHDVARERADALLPDVYDLKEAAASAIAARILDSVYAAPPEKPGKFATDFGNRCMASGGVLDAILGTRL